MSKNNRFSKKFNEEWVYEIVLYHCANPEFSKKSISGLAEKLGSSVETAEHYNRGKYLKKYNYELKNGNDIIIVRRNGVLNINISSYNQKKPQLFFGDLLDYCKPKSGAMMSYKILDDKIEPFHAMIFEHPDYLIRSFGGLMQSQIDFRKKV